eukprot:UN16114
MISTQCLTSHITLNDGVSRNTRGAQLFQAFPTSEHLFSSAGGVGSPGTPKDVFSND